jgi:hypothetical protein
MAKKKRAKKDQSVTRAGKSVNSRLVYLGVIASWVAYLLITTTTPLSANAYNLNSQQIFLLRLTIAIPFLLIWLAAAFSFVSIRKYAKAIEPSDESSAFNKISTGVLFLLASLIGSALISAVRGFLVDIHEARSWMTILTNYAYVIPYLFAFAYLFNGAADLIRQHNGFRISLSKYAIYAIPFFVLAYVWLEIIFTNPNRITPAPGSNFASYYLKDSLIVLTIVIPALFAWAMGFFGALKLRSYYQNVQGVIYKSALSSFVNGFLGVILGSIFIQSLLSLGAVRVGHLSLANVLALIYLFLIIQAVGFLLIARGARNLTKLESV